MIRFREDFGYWWPDYDHKPEVCFGLVTRNLLDIAGTVKLCRHRRVCVQAGAHAGLWPQALSESFGMVYAFEPDVPLFECAKLNIKATNVYLSQEALGAKAGRALLQRRSSAGSSRIDDVSGDSVDVTTIDSLDLNHCDAIFLDVEGYEVEALTGALRTIDRFNPVLHLEELDRSAADIQRMVKDLGYKKHHKVHKDTVYTR